MSQKKIYVNYLANFYILELFQDYQDFFLINLLSDKLYDIFIIPTSKGIYNIQRNIFCKSFCKNEQGRLGKLKTNTHKTETKKSAIQDKSSISFSIQVFYGLGVSYALVDQIFAQWVLYYYLPPRASALEPVLPPLFISLALVISRFVDMIADPAVGYFSDKISTGYGRRIPFIALGVIPLALTTVAFFYPPRTGTSVAFFYLAGVGCLFFIFYTIVGAPYNALIPELAESKLDRLNLSTWQSVFRLIYTAIAMVLPGWLITVIGQGDDERGVRGMVILLAALMIVTIFIMVYKVDEMKYSGGKSSNTGLKESLHYLIKNKSLQFYLLGLMFFFLGFNTLRGSLNYYIEDIMGYSTAAITLASALLFGSAALSFYPVNRLSRRYGYKKLLLVFLVALALLSLALTQVDRLLPAEAGFIIYLIAGIPTSGAAFIFPPAMLSEIAARLSDTQGVQIEGFYFGLQGFFLKLAFLLSIALLPILLVTGEGISLVEAMLGEPEAVTRQGIYYTSLLAAGSFLLSFLFYLGYQEES